MAERSKLLRITCSENYCSVACACEGHIRLGLERLAELVEEEVREGARREVTPRRAEGADDLGVK